MTKELLAEYGELMINLEIIQNKINDVKMRMKKEIESQQQLKLEEVK
jgi:hypothetical protein